MQLTNSLPGVSPLRPDSRAPVTLPVTPAPAVSETRYSPGSQEVAGIYNAKGQLNASPNPAQNRAAANPAWSAEQAALLSDLKARDREVRQHEQAHASSGGAHAGSPSFEYLQGPDGKAYANAGEVPIDVSRVNGDPGATIAKMQQVQAAALAPAQPSTQDRKVAAQAARLEQQAQRELQQQTQSLSSLKLKAYQQAAVSPNSGPSLHIVS